MKLFVGNIDLEVTDADLEQAFHQFSSLTSATVMKNWTTGEGHGYGFVEIENDEEARLAISQLHGSLLHDRVLTVLRREADLLS
jgi:RNA recognition motif-containing protein